ncbi:MAG: PAS domain-containing protein, partial [Lachnospiraceae bacterium]|nr:PAS domain-containing protein [Lachnospiraceae bacterium]
MAKKSRIPMIEQTLYDCMEMIPGGFCVVQKRDTYKIVFANRKLASMFGYEGREAVNALRKDVFSYVVDEDKIRLRDYFDRAKDVTTTITVIRKDRTVHRMAMEIRTSLLSSGIRHYLIAMTDADDISEQLQDR